jgi:hypothetical protein
VLTAGRVVPGVADRRQRRNETVEGMDFAGARASPRLGQGTHQRRGCRVALGGGKLPSGD